MRMQSLCMRANRFGCTYTFHRIQQRHECKSNRCTGNTVDSAGVRAADGVDADANGDGVIDSTEFEAAGEDTHLEEDLRATRV